ncbi:MAG: ribonuclease D, partial [Nitrospinales bacterium]
LLQVGGNGVYAAIDPIAIKNIGPVLERIKNPDVLKIFHAGKQDLEILHHLCGDAVKPVFDTQVAASLLGWGSQISFSKIVQKTTGKIIHKTETYTDWCRRPLSANQIAYALDDVRYLAPAYEDLLKRLRQLNRLDWVRDEFRSLEDPENYKRPSPRRQFLKIKNIRRLKPRNLSALVELAAWREGEAIKRDCHPKSVVRDEPLFEVARILPEKPSILGTIRGFPQKEISRSGAQIIEAVRKGLAVPKDQMPVLPETARYSTRPGMEELLAAFVQSRSEELKIQANVLADRKQIHNIVKYYEQHKSWDGNGLLTGWRKDILGSSLISILEGRSGLVADKNGKIHLVPMDKKEK